VELITKIGRWSGEEGDRVAVARKPDFERWPPSDMGKAEPLQEVPLYVDPNAGISP